MLKISHRNLNEKKCLIVGIKSSIGIEIEKIFENSNYDVFGTSRKFQDSFNPKEIFLDFDNVESLNKLSQKIPNLDSLVFCTGILLGKNLKDYKDEEILDVFQSNIVGPITTLSRIIKKLNKKCSVLFVGSIAGSAGSYDEIYASAKSAIYALVKSLAKKSDNSIRFNCISPGLIDNSTMISKFSPSEIEQHKKETPTNELNKIENIAKICFDISQDEWSQLNGQIIDINGGRYV